MDKLQQEYLNLEEKYNELLKERNKLFSVIKETRAWYKKSGFDMLAPCTPIVFSKLLSLILEYNKQGDSSDYL